MLICCVRPWGPFPAAGPGQRKGPPYLPPGSLHISDTASRQRWRPARTLQEAGHTHQGAGRQGHSTRQSPAAPGKPGCLGLMVCACVSSCLDAVSERGSFCVLC